MNKLFHAVLALGLMISVPAFAETAASAMTIKGTIICNKCMGKPAAVENLAAFIKDHPKECMLHAGCAASGYSLYTGSKTEKFSKDSETQIKDFLGKADSKTTVEVTAKETNGELTLVSIKNQS